MSGDGAMAITALILVAAAIVLAVAADEAIRDARRRLVRGAWTLFAASVAMGIAAAWVGALT